MTKTTDQRFARLVKIAKHVEPYAHALAVTLGNFRGTNDFAKTEPSLHNRFVLGEFHLDLIAIVVLRTSALLSRGGGSTDATLRSAAEFVGEPEVRARIAKQARAWVPGGDEHFAMTNERAAMRRVDRFLHVLADVDDDKLSKHRNWLLAHNTTKKPPGVLFIEVWEAAEATLLAADDLVFFALGHDRDLVGVAVSRRQESSDFWRLLNEGSN